ncbi:MAG: hypothetical protein JW850_16960, partial [Thermoflexales bacterium]|nr:hypothetical protein [Thermoflexales bacterium]
AACYEDAELVEAGISPAQESDLHLYRYAGVYTWTEYSQVDPVNNLITATNVTELGTWGLGVPDDAPTAVILSQLSITVIGLHTAHMVGSDLPWIALLIGVSLCLACLAVRRRT